MDPPEESVVPLGTKKRPGGGIQESAYLDEFDYSFPATSSKHGLRRSGAIQENALKDSRILRPTLSSIAKSRNALRVRSYLRAEAEKRGGPRIASPGDCITGAEGDLLADAIGVHDNAKRLKSSHSSIVAPGSPDRRRAPPAEGTYILHREQLQRNDFGHAVIRFAGVPSRYSRGETASGSAEQAVNCDERTLELAARDVEYLTEEIK